MEVLFKAPKVLGGKSYKAGQHVVPDHLAFNLAFKQAVKAGEIQPLARDAAQQQILAGHNAKAHHRAREARLAHKQRLASKSAQDASGAQPAQLGASGPVQAIHQSAEPIQAGAAEAPASAQEE